MRITKTSPLAIVETVPDATIQRRAVEESVRQPTRAEIRKNRRKRRAEQLAVYQADQDQMLRMNVPDEGGDCMTEEISKPRRRRSRGHTMIRHCEREQIIDDFVNWHEDKHFENLYTYHRYYKRHNCYEAVLVALYREFGDDEAMKPWLTFRHPLPDGRLCDSSRSYGDANMSVATRSELTATLEKDKRTLAAMARIVDGEVGSLARAFEVLAGHADEIVHRASCIVACVEDETISLVLPKVQTLGLAARRFIGERLEATVGILDTVSAEAALLRQLSSVACGQETIALEIKALSVLTDIEVARLGTVGAGFQYLAHELSDFSRSVVEDTQELASQTDARRAVIEETRRVLTADLPRLRQSLSRIEGDLGDALAVVDASLTQLASTPAQFRRHAEEVARQISGVVAAIQSHDINRQMNEHVQEALALICARLCRA